MALAQHRLFAWVWQGDATDPRTGLLEMTRAQFTAYGARAQDLRVGGLHLKQISNDLYEPVVPGATAPAHAGAPTAPHRRRGRPGRELEA
jgi:hypothetical protein